MTMVHWLPEDPLERGEDVGVAHVSSCSLDAVTCRGQVLLQGRTVAGQTGPRFTTWHGVSKWPPEDEFCSLALSSGTPLPTHREKSATDVIHPLSMSKMSPFAE